MTKLPSHLHAELMRYLPTDLASAVLEEQPAPAALTAASQLLRERLTRMLPLLPAPVARQRLAVPAPGKPLVQQWRGSLLFADLSGFTALSEQLSSLGREGSEIVTLVINRLFAGLSEQISRYGGDLLKFGGDAMTAFFSADEHGAEHAALAVAAAHGMQQRMLEIGLVETRLGQQQLLLRIGVHSGSFTAAQLGDTERMDLLITGPVVHTVAKAQDVALPGEVVITDATAAHLTDAQLIARGPQFGALQSFTPPTPRPSPPLLLPAETAPGADLPQLLQAAQALRLFLPHGINAEELSAAVAEGFRLVTVLFAHVASLSEVLERLPAVEIATPLLNSYYCKMQQAVHSFGGSVNKLDLASDGDKLLACFGAPITRENDEELTVRAALAMQAALTQVNADLAALDLDLPALHQEIGISTGHVFAGLVGTPIRREYTVMGDVVNLAARLMAYAPHDTIWLSSATQRQVAHLFELQQQEPLLVKGKRQEVTPWTVARVYASERQRRSGPLARAPFVGREAEVSQLREAAVAALQGQGGVIVLQGEAGVGKTRLVEEVLQWLMLMSLVPDAPVRPFTLLTTECQSYEQIIPFAALRDLLQQLLQLPARSLNDAAAQVALVEQRVERMVPELARFAPLLGDVLGLDIPETTLTRALSAEQRRDRTHDLLEALLSAGADQQPLVLIFDDLQWCDASSFDALRRFCTVAKGQPILLLLLLRELPAGRPVWDASALMLHLRELDSAAGSALVAALLDGQAPPALLERVRTADEGYNPFFVEELIHALIDDGAIQRGPQGWELRTDIDALALPDTIEGVITARIDRLDQQLRQTLQVASVIGRRFALTVLADVEDDHHQLPDELKILSSADLILPQDQQDYLFKHMLTRDAVYTNILYARRRLLHRRVAESIEHLYGLQDEYRPLLANHYFAAEDWPRALEHSLEAARAALHHFHYQEAIRLLELSLRAAAQTTPEPQIVAECYERLGYSHLQISSYDEARVALEQALAIQRSMSQPDEEAMSRIYRHLATICAYRGTFDEGFALVQEALGLVSPESVQYPRLLLVGAGMYQRQGRYAEAVSWSEESLTAAERHGLVTDLAHGYAQLSGTLCRLGRHQQALEVAGRSLDLYRELNDPVGQISAQTNLAIALTGLRSYRQAAQGYEEALALSYVVGDVFGQAILANNLGDLYLKIGDYQPALENFVTARDKFEKIRSDYGVAVSFMNSAQASIFLGEFEHARQSLNTSRSIFEEIKADDFMAELYRGYAQLAIATEDYAAAQECAEKSLSYAQAMEASGEIAAAQKLLGIISEALGNYQAAFNHYQAALPYVQESGNDAEEHDIRARYERVRGLLHQDG